MLLVSTLFYLKFYLLIVVCLLKKYKILYSDMILYFRLIYIYLV